MKKKVLTLGMAIIMGLNLMSCGGNSIERAADSVKTEIASALKEEAAAGASAKTTSSGREQAPAETNTSGEEQTSAETEMTSETEAPASDAGAEEVDATALRDYKFSEGFAWVMLDGNPAVVDSDGMIRFVVDVSEAKAAGAHTLRTTPFVDGASALYDEYGVSDNGFGGFEIYDSEGNVLFDSEDGDDTTELNILAAGDGYYLIGKSVQSMAVSENTIYVIDKNGNVLVQEHPVQYFNSFTYAGDGAFASTAFGASSILIDTNNKTVYDSNTVEFDSEDYWKTEARTMVMAHGNGDTIGVANAYGIARYYSKLDYSWEYNSVSADEYTESGWYDAEGNLKLAAPSFPDGVYYIAVGNFVGDYAPVFIAGVDGNLYASVVDGTGQTLFEPVRIYDGETLREFTSDKNGTVFFKVGGDAGSFLLKDGTVINPKEDGLSALPADTSIECVLPEKSISTVINEGICHASNFGGQMQYIRLNGEDIRIMLPAGVTTVQCAAIKKQ